MLHPSYTELMKVINEGSEDNPVINSRYSIVMATAKRARQIVAGEGAVTEEEAAKPLSTAVSELESGLIHILPEKEEEDDLLLTKDMTYLTGSSAGAGFTSADGDEDAEDKDAEGDGDEDDDDADDDADGEDDADGDDA